MIKRLIFRVIMLIVIATAIMSYIATINGIDLRQFLPKLERPQLPSFKLPEIKFPTGDSQDTLPTTVSKVYKWRGEDGSWHFSENLPEGVTSVETLFLNANTNLIKGLPQPNKTKTSINTINDDTPPQSHTQPVDLNPYSKQAIEKLLDDAGDVQKIMDKHALDLENATQNK